MTRAQHWFRLKLSAGYDPVFGSQILALRIAEAELTKLRKAA